MANLKKKLPRVEDIDKYIYMTFVGSEQNWEAFQPSVHNRVPDLQVCPSVIYGWLRALKAVNPLYKDIEIIDTEEHVLALQSISDCLVKQTTLLDNQILEIKEGKKSLNNEQNLLMRA